MTNHHDARARDGPPTSSASTPWPARPARPGTSSTRCGLAERAGPGVGLHLRALRQEGGGRPVGRGRGGERADVHRHRGHQPQHPAPDDHRRHGPDHAEPHRGPVRARPGPGDPRHPGHLRHPPGHHRPARGLRRHHAPAVPGRGHHRPRRAVRRLPGAVPGRHRRGTPPRPGGLRARTRWPSAVAASTGSSSTPSSPRRPPGGAWPPSRSRPSGPAGTPTPCRCGRAWPPSATTSTRTAG